MKNRREQAETGGRFSVSFKKIEETEEPSPVSLIHGNSNEEA